MKTITILGGSGFIGSSLVAKLDQAGYQVKVLTRRREQAKHLILLPHVSVVECDLYEQHQLKSQLAGSDAVINLVGILHPSGKHSFERVHHQLPRRLAQLCEELGIPRLIHMSALQAAAKAPSDYLRSKAAGEAAVLERSKRLKVTIFKPSVVFGAGDQFINMFAMLVKYLPVMLLAMPHAKFQPVWVEDVTSAMVNALENKATYGNTYELGGPEVLSLQDIIEQVMCMLNISRPIIGLNRTFSMVQAWFMELAPKPLMTRDNVKSMLVDNVTAEPIAPELGVSPARLSTVMQPHLQNATQRGAYNAFRTAAGRAINARR